MPSTILITGCSSGFGKATASFFLACGWNVIATMRTPQPGLFEDSDQLLLLPLDVTQPDSIADAIGKSVARFGKIDVFVNNAGIGYFGAHEAVPDEAIRQLFETNTFGVMAANRAIIPHMRGNGSGTIINVTSSVGIAPMPLVAAYTASKYAIEGFSESLAYETGVLGIRVKIVQPGLAPTTHFAANSAASGDHPIPPAYSGHAARYFQSMQDYPTGYTTEEDVAKAVHAAATDEGDGFRYPAGADSAMLAGLRASLPEQEFIRRIRAMTGSEPAR
ncbi:SDR family oxidoreductase [Luteolibacter ambystomatis]|uniref:SDR family oxidoreductase n=1 Tax=Luteolibacter ambystomatis TaxID=2824561 RepID=A0A975J2M0_9BACT|nr:SDR family oxidoreductase [Luteolibacter ambystomatis]QUE52874.1 SDR family oxidoreductase [Luteolibacter ambystomatis]